MRDIFLDRDGVINENRDSHVTSWSEFEFLPGTLKALRLLTAAGFRIFVVTNQACVNRGLLSVGALDDIHRRMREAAGRRGARITDVRFCPHRPDEACGCRKPMPGMLLELAQTYGISLGETYLVGDALTDVAAGRAAGCRTVLVQTGRGAAQIAAAESGEPQPDLIADNLLDAARRLCAGERRWRAPARGEPATVYGRAARGAAEERPLPC